jgi:GNAT superfamily N-acetyltransferase
MAEEIDLYLQNPQREAGMPFARLIVLRDDTRVAGHAFLKFGQVAVSGQAQDLTCHIDDISLHPDFRGQGLGKALLEKIESVCHDEGASVVQGHVWRGNHTSEKLFENAAFQTAAKIFSKRMSAPYLPPTVQYTRSAMQDARKAIQNERPVETSESIRSALPFLLIGAVLLILVSSIIS